MESAGAGPLARPWLCLGPGGAVVSSTWLPRRQTSERGRRWTAFLDRPAAHHLQGDVGRLARPGRSDCSAHVTLSLGGELPDRLRTSRSALTTLMQSGHSSSSRTRIESSTPPPSSPDFWGPVAPCSRERAARPHYTTSALVWQRALALCCHPRSPWTSCERRPAPDRSPSRSCIRERQQRRADCSYPCKAAGEAGDAGASPIAWNR